jgi:hypothetical protein
VRRREFLGCAAGVGLAGGADGEPPAAAVAHDLADLDRAVQAALASKRLGQPVFVRLTQRGGTKPVERLARLAALASSWLGQRPARLHAVGGEAGPASLTVLFAAGASAIVGVTPGEPAGALDLMLLGSRGALHHEIAEPFTFGTEKADPKWVKEIRRALTKGSPVEVEAP